MGPVATVPWTHGSARWQQGAQRRHYLPVPTDGCGTLDLSFPTLVLFQCRPPCWPLTRGSLPPSPHWPSSVPFQSAAHLVHGVCEGEGGGEEAPDGAPREQHSHAVAVVALGAAGRRLVWREGKLPWLGQSARCKPCAFSHNFGCLSWLTPMPMYVRLLPTRHAPHGRRTHVL